MNEKETALILKAKMEKLRDRLQAIVDDEDLDIFILDETDTFSGWDLFLLISELDDQIAKITKKYLL